MNMRENTIAADGIYLVVEKGDEDGVWIPVQDAGRSEFVRSSALMPLKVLSAEARLSRDNTPIIRVGPLTQEEFAARYPNAPHGGRCSNRRRRTILALQ
ncbi:MAG: hypothetical protein ABUS57_05445 [Pseudomonadota bacterium]